MKITCNAGVFAGQELVNLFTYHLNFLVAFFNSLNPRLISLAQTKKNTKKSKKIENDGKKRVRSLKRQPVCSLAKTHSCPLPRFWLFQ